MSIRMEVFFFHQNMPPVCWNNTQISINIPLEQQLRVTFVQHSMYECESFPLCRHAPLISQLPQCHKAYGLSPIAMKTGWPVTSRKKLTVHNLCPPAFYISVAVSLHLSGSSGSSFLKHCIIKKYIIRLRWKIKYESQKYRLSKQTVYGNLGRSDEEHNMRSP